MVIRRGRVVVISENDERIIGDTVFFRGLPGDVAATIHGHSSVRTFERGATVFLQGEAATGFFLVLSGWVKLYRVSQNGAEAVVGVFTRGQSFAEAVAFQGKRYPVSAEAVTECRLYRVNAGLVIELMKSKPELCTAMIGATFMHLHELVVQVEQLKSQTGAQRVAEFLIELCPADAGTCTVTLPYDKVLIAGRLGMKPESLSRAFTRLRDNGVEVRQNDAIISDVGRLRQYVEEDPAMAWTRAR